MPLVQVHHPEAALHAARGDTAFHTQGTVVSGGLDDDVFKPWAPLLALNVKLKPLLVTYRSAITLAASPSAPSHAVNDRRSARKDVNENLQDCGRELTKFGATLTADKANSYILIAGFTPWARPLAADLPEFGITDGKNHGSVVVRIKSPTPGKRVNTEVQGSSDGGKSWPLQDSGSNLIYRFTGLAIGLPWVFRYRVKILGVWSDWKAAEAYTVR